MLLAVMLMVVTENVLRPQTSGPERRLSLGLRLTRSCDSTLLIPVDQWLKVLPQPILVARAPLLVRQRLLTRQGPRLLTLVELLRACLKLARQVAIVAAHGRYQADYCLFAVVRGKARSGVHRGSRDVLLPPARRVAQLHLLSHHRLIDKVFVDALVG